MRSAIFFATHIKSSARKLYTSAHVEDRGNPVDILVYWGNDSMAILEGQEPKSGE